MNNLGSPPWLAPLQVSLTAEYPDRPRIAVLATVDAGNRPRARSVILRRIDSDGALWIISNAHAGKNAQLRHIPFAELVLYLPTSRRQFRLAGAAQVIGGGQNCHDLRHRFWLDLSDAARAMFYWPTIGRPADPGEQVVSSMPAQTPMPDEFELIRIDPDHVEHLTTDKIPHLRTRWRQDNDWREEQINP